MVTAPMVLCAQAVGYGPAAKLLAVAERLRRAGVRPVLLGTGVAHELLSRSPDLGDAVEAGPDDRRARAIVRDASVVLSVMDVGYARLALDLSRPLHVADSLSWLRHPVPPEFLSARRYWVQDFPGVREHVRRIRPRPTVVGPIISGGPRPGANGRAGLLVNLGGYDTPYAHAADDAGWAEFVVTGLLDAGLAESFPGGTVLMAGARCAAKVAERLAARGVRCVSVSHPRAAELRAGAAVVLTAPGLTSTLEGLRSGTPTFFLPPQNYSQWWILRRLRAAGLAPCALHWADHLPPAAVPEGLTLEQRVPLVRGAIAALVGEPHVRRRFRASLQEMVGWPRAELAAAQRRAFEDLGPDGAATIAAGLRRELDDHERQPQPWEVGAA